MAGRKKGTKITSRTYTLQWQAGSEAMEAVRVASKKTRMSQTELLSLVAGAFLDRVCATGDGLAGLVEPALKERELKRLEAEIAKLEALKARLGEG